MSAILLGFKIVYFVFSGWQWHSAGRYNGPKIEYLWTLHRGRTSPSVSWCNRTKYERTRSSKPRCHGSEVRRWTTRERLACGSRWSTPLPKTSYFLRKPSLKLFWFYWKVVLNLYWGEFENVKRQYQNRWWYVCMADLNLSRFIVYFLLRLSRSQDLFNVIQVFWNVVLILVCWGVFVMEAYIGSRDVWTVDKKMKRDIPRIYMHNGIENVNILELEERHHQSSG